MLDRILGTREKAMNRTGKIFTDNILVGNKKKMYNTKPNML